MKGKGENRRKGERVRPEGARRNEKRNRLRGWKRRTDQTLRDPQAGVFELRPLRRLPFRREGRVNGRKEGMMFFVRGGKREG